ncbi:hypothetical protein EOM86_14410 [Candidatus Nomurabacteria bacterium]|nr:hypothetical protein [Candidatus Nomurabacteria bacterium]
MPTVTELLRRGLLKDIPDRVQSLEKLRISERSSEFEKFRTNRKIVGAFRYGIMGAENKPQWERIPDMIYRLCEYQVDRNKEHLVDVANLCELEFVEGDGVFLSKESSHHTKEK